MSYYLHKMCICRGVVSNYVERRLQNGRGAILTLQTERAENVLAMLKGGGAQQVFDVVNVSLKF